MQKVRYLMREDTLTNQLERVEANIAFWKSIPRNSPEHIQEIDENLAELKQTKTEIKILLKKLDNEKGIHQRPNGWPTEQ